MEEKDVIDVVKELVKMGLTGVNISYDENKESYYYDLNTKSKSHLHLYEDFHVEGRYGYTYIISPYQEIEDIICDLFYEFKKCQYGRGFYNKEWMEIGVKLCLIEKKVETHMFITYE